MQRKSHYTIFFFFNTETIIVDFHNPSMNCDFWTCDYDGNRLIDLIQACFLDQMIHDPTQENMLAPQIEIMQYQFIHTKKIKCASNYRPISFTVL